MRNTHDQRIRDALWQLYAAPASDNPPVSPRLVFLRTQAIACLWIASLLTVVALLALGRIQVPHVVRGTAVAVRARSGDTTLVLLLPASARAYAHAGQNAILDSATGTTVTVNVIAIDSVLLDTANARTRFDDLPSLNAQLAAPKLVVRLARCGPNGCLTPSPGVTYTATAVVGTRSLANYALSGS